MPVYTCENHNSRVVEIMSVTTHKGYDLLEFAQIRGIFYMVQKVPENTFLQSTKMSPGVLAIIYN